MVRSQCTLIPLEKLRRNRRRQNGAGMVVLFCAAGGALVYVVGWLFQ